MLTHYLVHDHSIDQQQMLCMLQLPMLQDNTSYLTYPQYIAGLVICCRKFVACGIFKELTFTV